MTPPERILGCVRRDPFNGTSFAGIAAAIQIPEINLEHTLRGMLNRKEIELHGGRYHIPKPIDPDATLEEAPMAETKRCRACDKDKPVTEFYDGHGKCKPCFIIHNKANADARRAKAEPIKPAAKPKPLTSPKVATPPQGRSLGSRAPRHRPHFPAHGECRG